jgi:CRISPR-associated Csx10 family RAMP protein
MAKVSITFDIEVLSPLHLGRAPIGVGEYLFTQQHVPGTALRGALAEVLIKKSVMDPESATFKQLFKGPQALRFEPAYPATLTDWGYPFPLTARCCKAKGGFPPPDTRPEMRKHYHGVFDILVSQVVFEERLAALKDEGVPLPFMEQPRCPHCWKGVEPASGGYVWDELDERPAARPKPDLVRHTHTAINRARGVAEDGMLYTVETLEPGARLRGCLWVEETQADKVRGALGNITRLGRGVRRGRGRVQVTPRGEVEPGDTQARIEELTDLFQAERAFYTQLTGREVSQEETEGYYFTLDLLSPAIFGNGITATLVPDDLGMQLIRSFVAPEIAGGWWKAAGLPHPTALAAATGSVFLYYVPPETDLTELSAQLDELRATGIGRLRERGYGAVMPCASFHLWTAEKEAARQ